ncbi:MAG: hypothetical protein ACLQDQ_05445 [Myxococcaceae bacterium]
MNVLIILSKLGSLGGIGQRLAGLTEQARFQATTEKMARDTLWELETAVKRLEARKPTAVTPAIDLTDEQVVALVFPLFEQAVLSATSERRRMLAAAMAGMFQPDVGVETKSRLLRAVSSLEPSDARVLRHLDAAPLYEADGTTVHHERLSLPGVSIEALAAAGCVHLRNMGNIPVVTDFGETLLRFLGEGVEERPLQTG